jgi:hypothetical protein
MMEGMDSPFIASSVQRATSSWLVVVAVSLLAMILNPAMSVSIADDIPKISLTQPCSYGVRDKLMAESLQGLWRWVGS